MCCSAAEKNKQRDLVCPKGSNPSSIQPCLVAATGCLRDSAIRVQRLTGLYAGKQLVAGAMSAVVSRTALAPLERVKMDIVLHRKHGVLRTAQGILVQDGVGGFWHGCLLNIMRTAPFKVCHRPCQHHASEPPCIVSPQLPQPSQEAQCRQC